MLSTLFLNLLLSNLASHPGSSTPKIHDLKLVIVLAPKVMLKFSFANFWARSITSLSEYFLYHKSIYSMLLIIFLPWSSPLVCINHIINKDHIKLCSAPVKFTGLSLFLINKLFSNLFL